MKLFITYGFLFFSLIICFKPSPLYGKGEADKAKNYFEEGAYKDALMEWNKLIETGNTTAALYYNIGLTESKLHHTAEALLAFEKALRIKPGSRLIQQAIELERENINTATIPVNPFFLKEWYKQLIMLLRPGFWVVLGLLSLLIVLIRFLINQRHKPGQWSIDLKRSRFLIAGGFLLLLIGFLSYGELNRDNEAIIGKPCSFRQAPSVDSPTIKEIGEGEKVVLVDQIGDWYNVYLLNQDAGWVKSDCLWPITIGN